MKYLQATVQQFEERVINTWKMSVKSIIWIGLCEQDLPSADANQIANNLSNLGQIYNREDSSTDVLVSITTLSVDIVHNNNNNHIKADTNMFILDAL